VKRVAIVILNWNGERFLRQFLPDVVKHSEHIADVVVIDNASTDGSLDLLKSEFPSVKIVVLDKNYGFAGGYNLGLKEVPNEMVVLLNSDVEVTPGWIEPVLEYMESEKDMVACQPKILDFHRKAWFEYAGAAGGYLDKDGFAFCAGRMFYAFEEDLGQYTENTEVFWASGASLFIKRNAYFEVGGLDEDFFAHMEEIDLCWRLKNRGYKIGSCRKSAVYHYGGGTLDRMNPFKTYLNFRNNMYLILKNHRGTPVALRLMRRLVLDGIAGMRFLTEGNFGYFTAVIKAHFSFYGNFGLMWKKRKAEEKALRNPNLTGMYKRSVIKHFFVFKQKNFGQLLTEDFVKAS
jgi:GT2 family glycosyltransferase